MDEADYLREQAAKLRERAERTRSRKVRKDLLEDAAVCEEVAADIEFRAVSG
jgi:hypothetical protein